MKKFFTLLLALLLCVGLTAPAMAFTSDTSEDVDTPYGLKIYLVDYEDNDLFGLVALPESDRGYAKNEIVAAVVELNIPKDENIVKDGYRTLDISGDNVSFNVTDNDGGADLRNSDAATFPLSWKHDPADGFTLKTFGMDDDVTYKWLVFAKVTDDDASLTAKLIDGKGSDDFWGTPGHAEITLEGVDYRIQKTDDGYTITVADHSDDYNGDQIFIDVDDDNVSEGMSILIAAPHDGNDPDPYALGVNTKNQLGIVDPDNPAKILTDGDEYDAVMDVYNDIVVDTFGMDYFKIGNYVRDSYFEDLVSSDTITATVDIKPWVAYVTVPTEVVVDPPKTGDAASLMGFVMVALSAAGTLALKRRF